MATSPRNELVIESLVVFGHFDDGWVWAERTPDGSVVLDSSEKSFEDMWDAVADFLNDRGINTDMPVFEGEAHYSKVIPVGEDEAHIRKYKYGAPDPIQRTWNINV